MNQLIIKKMKANNYAWMSSYEVNFQSGINRITGRNGSGKSSILKAILWVLTGKDPDGKVQAGYKNEDCVQQDLPCEVRVSLTIEIGGETHTLTRLQLEQRNSANELIGHVNEYRINDATMSKGDYEQWIENEIGSSDDMLLMLTPTNFLTRGWQERREALMRLADMQAIDQRLQIKYHPLFAELNDRKMDMANYLAALKFERKKEQDALDLMPARIDENRRGLKDDSELERLQRQLKVAEELRDEARGKADNVDTKTLDEIHKRLAKAQNLILEKEEKAQELLQIVRKEKEGLLTEWKKNMEAVEEEWSRAKDQNRIASRHEERIKSIRDELTKIHNEYKAAQEEAPPTFDDGQCSACGQELPDAEEKAAAHLAQWKEAQAAKIARLKKEGEIEKANYEALKAEQPTKIDIAKLEEKLEAIRSEESKLVRVWEEGERCRQLRAAYKEEVEAGKSATIARERTEAEYKAAKEEIQEPEKLRAMATSHAQEVDRLQKEINSFDNSRVDAREKELVEEQKSIAARLAKVEKQISDVEDYRLSRAVAIEESVNRHFETIKFRLFQDRLNGEIKNVCDAMIGKSQVPDSSASTGEKIRAGCEIVAAFREQAKVALPLIIDNAEGLSGKPHGIDDVQTIALVVNAQPLAINPDVKFNGRVKEGVAA